MDDLQGCIFMWKIWSQVVDSVPLDMYHVGVIVSYNKDNVEESMVLHYSPLKSHVVKYEKLGDAMNNSGIKEVFFNTNIKYAKPNELPTRYKEYMNYGTYYNFLNHNCQTYLRDVLNMWFVAESDVLENALLDGFKDMPYYVTTYINLPLHKYTHRYVR